MIRKIVLLFCCFGLAVQISISSASTPDRFSVLTWNVLGLEAAQEMNAFKALPKAEDRIMSPVGNFVLPTAKGAVTYPTVLAVLGSFNADILCLQEVSKVCRDDITAALAAQNYALAHWQQKGSRAGTCIYYKVDKFTCCSKIIALDLPVDASLSMSSSISSTSSLAVPSPDSLDELSGSMVASPSKYVKGPDVHDSPELLAMMASTAVTHDGSGVPAAAGALVGGSSLGTTVAATAASPLGVPASGTSSSPKEAFGMCVGVYLKSKHNGSELLVCSVHLVRPKVKMAAPIMVKQMQKVVDLVRNCCCPVVIAGDFNIGPVPMINIVLPESLEQAMFRKEEEGRFKVLFSGEFIDTNRSSDFILSRHVLYHSDQSCSGEDFCFAPGVSACATPCPSDGKHERFPSDHVPLFAQFDIDISSNIRALNYYLKSLTLLGVDLKSVIGRLDNHVLRDVATKYHTLSEWIYGGHKDVGNTIFAEYKKRKKFSAPVI